MDDALTLVLIVGIIGIIGGVMFMQHRKRKNAQWSGTVIDKDTKKEYIHNTRHSRRNRRRGGSGIGLAGAVLAGNSMRRGNYTLKYYIFVKTDEGEEIKWEVSDGLYEEVNIGDQLKKEPGTTIPEITQKAE